MTFDASRCVDYLETIPSVDKEKIGCIGFILDFHHSSMQFLYRSRNDQTQRRGQYRDDRVPCAGDIENFAGLGRKVQG